MGPHRGAQRMLLHLTSGTAVKTILIIASAGEPADSQWLTTANARQARLTDNAGQAAPTAPDSNAPTAPTVGDSTPNEGRITPRATEGPKGCVFDLTRYATFPMLNDKQDPRTEP